MREVSKLTKPFIMGMQLSHSGQYQNIETEIAEGNACPDHIYMMIKIPSKYSVSEVIGFLKGKRVISKKNFWSREYCVSTVGIDEKFIRKYIQDQWKKDKF